MATIYKREEVKKHCTRSSCWVVVQNKVYNVTSFLQDHPGGSEFILQFAGDDITAILKDSTYHAHSIATYEILEEYYIGEVDQIITHQENQFDSNKEQTSNKMGTGRDQAFLDLQRPLLYQMWNSNFTKDYYLEQVHRPRYTTHTVPFFENPYLDLLTKTHWYFIPLIWFPVSFFLAWKSFNSTDGSLHRTSQGFMAGAFFWTLFEYTLHRFLFHLDDLLPDTPTALFWHFTLHGMHHHMPMDRLRLVMPPLITAILSVPVFIIPHILFYPAFAHAFIAGTLSAYVCYDLIHYYLHHAKVFKFYFGELKRYHIAHHYKNYSLGFGVTSKFWDYMFGTLIYLDNKEK
ncbi:hypothetical protein G6F43_007353 [Rhizopus delemar]|nr:hypothetical protein G6F43_007353 [Rhizopus delemar]